jgi:cytoskeleton protein RodZ
MTEATASAVEAPPREPGVGETLARARAALGLSVEDCAQQLKFPVRRIQALEAERFEELPAGTFARGMLRSYARLLKLDAEALVDRVGQFARTPDTFTSAVSLRQPIPFAEASGHSNLLYVALTLIALAVAGWVAWGWMHERSGATRMSFVSPSRGLPDAPVTQGARQGSTGAPGGGASVASIASTVTPKIAPINQEPAAPAKPAAEAAPPAAGQKRIVMRFEKESWVEVRSGAARKVLLSQVNAAGSERVIEGEPPFVLVIGNAPHVRVTYDDKPVELVPHARTEVAKVTLD